MGGAIKKPKAKEGVLKWLWTIIKARYNCMKARHVCMKIWGAKRLAQPLQISLAVL
jgi:hypothetical protein